MTQNSTVIVTATGIEHLEWLKFSFTQGMARDLVEGSLLGAPGFEGYRYATITEAAILLQSYYHGPIDNHGDLRWEQNTAQTAQLFLTDFGMTRVYIPDPPNQTLSLDNGEYIPYDMLRYAYFYCGAYGVDIESNLVPPATLVGRVGEALNGIDFVAGLFTYGELYGLAHQGRCYYSSLLVREYAPVSAVTGFRITAK